MALQARLMIVAVPVCHFSWHSFSPTFAHPVMACVQLIALKVQVRERCQQHQCRVKLTAADRHAKLLDARFTFEVQQVSHMAGGHCMCAIRNLTPRHTGYRCQYAHVIVAGEQLTQQVEMFNAMKVGQPVG